MVKQVAQRGCTIFSLGNFQVPPGENPEQSDPVADSAYKASKRGVGISF